MERQKEKPCVITAMQAINFLKSQNMKGQGSVLGAPNSRQFPFLKIQLTDVMPEP